MMPIHEWEKCFKEQEAQAKKDFFTFLSFPSISAQPESKQGIEECCNWLYQQLDSLNFHVEKWATGRHPILFAQSLDAGPDKPTLLIYNHYDVQPVDPLEEWLNPPFQPTERKGKIYARGAQDNKGQCGYVLQAIKLWRKHRGAFPCNIKWCIEGEEEIGSPSLAAILAKKRPELKADTLAIVDLGLPAPDQPVLCLGVRGILTMDVSIKEAKTDVHSGFLGGMIQNPIHVLSKILASLHDEEGRVTVPGFYDEVQKLSAEEENWIDFTFDEAAFEKSFGIKPRGGEKGYAPLERAWIRPTLEINGISGGYAGEGFKTVIPAKAQAKISCRLVPNQDPAVIAGQVRQHLERMTPEGISITVQIHSGTGRGIRTDPLSSGVQTFSQAFSEVYQKPCHFTLEGGSIPIVPELARASGASIVLLGLGLMTDQIHAPNEHFDWDRFQKGTLIFLHVLESYASAIS